MWWWLACTMMEPASAPGDEVATAVPQGALPSRAADPVAAMRRRPLSITRHGACRMDCRQLDRAEVEQILEEGALQPERSRSDGACPTHALEGVTRDGQHERMVFAACARDTRLVTAIDLDTEWPCRCD